MATGRTHRATGGVHPPGRGGTRSPRLPTAPNTDAWRSKVHPAFAEVVEILQDFAKGPLTDESVSKARAGLGKVEERYPDLRAIPYWYPFAVCPRVLHSDKATVLERVIATMDVIHWERYRVAPRVDFQQGKAEFGAWKRLARTFLDALADVCGYKWSGLKGEVFGHRDIFQLGLSVGLGTCTHQERADCLATVCKCDGDHDVEAIRKQWDRFMRVVRRVNVNEAGE